MAFNQDDANASSYADALDTENNPMEANSNEREGEEPHLNSLQALLKVTKVDGSPIPPFLFHREAIAEMLSLMTGIIPATIDVLDDTETLLTFEEGVIMTPMIIQICQNHVWYGLEVRLTAKVASPDVMERMHNIRQRQEQSKMDLFGHWANGGTNVQMGTNVQAITSQLMERLTLHLDEKVERLQDMVHRSQTDLKKEVSQNVMETVDRAVKKTGDRDLREQIHMQAAVNTKKPPKLSWFSGEDNKNKTEVTYAQWAYEVLMVKDNYSEEVMKEAIARSLKGTAADLIRFLGPHVTLQQMMEKLETVYSTVSSFDTLMQGFYNLSQGPREKVQQFATKMESTLNQIQVQFPDRMGPNEKEVKLKERLFHGMKKNVRDTIRFRYSDPSTTYTQLLVHARAAEDEEIKVPTVAATAKGAEVYVETSGEEDEEITELSNKFMVMAITDNGKGKKRKQLVPVSKALAQKEDDNQEPAERRKKSSLTMRRERVPRNVQCWACEGFGHLARSCPNRLNSNRGKDEALTRPPQNQNNDSQRNRNQNQNQKEEKRESKPSNQ